MQLAGEQGSGLRIEGGGAAGTGILGELGGLLTLQLHLAVLKPV